MADMMTDPAKHWEIVARSNFKRIDQLEEALRASIKLQSYYVKLLNMHDGGERLQFDGTVDEWVDRVRSLKDKEENIELKNKDEKDEDRYSGNAF